MTDKADRLTGVYSYTYDQFTVFFYNGRVFVGGKDYPIGQCTVDIMNLDDTVFAEIDRRVRGAIPAAQDLLREKTDGAAALAQEKLIAVWDIVFTLPVYRDLNMDVDVHYRTFERLRADEERWAQVQDPTSAGYAIYQGMLTQLAHFAADLFGFRQQIAIMIEEFFEPLKRRNCGAYAEAYSRFYAQMLSIGAYLFQDDFRQNIPVEVDFVPMMTRDGNGIFVAEKAVFNRLTGFLQTEFYRGLAAGNAPRRCHNCGRFFLLTEGYNTCYCNNIAPGETERTCRKVGAHRKEAQGKANRTPAQREYGKTYNRLKQRKVRGKITVDEWNAAVAKAQELVERSERGEISDEELARRLGEL